MSKKWGKIITIEDFDPYSRSEPIINSPRSIEACRRQGILPEELLVKTIDDIKAMHKGQKLEKEALELMSQHFEERRREKIRVLIEERAQLIEDEKNGFVSFNSPQNKEKSKSLYGTMAQKSKMDSLMNTHTESTLVEREKRQLEKIKFRQEKELRNMLDYETKMAEIRKIQEEKLNKQQQKEQQREMEIQRRRMEEEERKHQFEQDKLRKEQEDEERAKRMAAEAYRREQERLAQEKENERRRKIEARMREEEAKRKHEEFVKKTEDKLWEQQMRVAKKKEEMDERDRQRLEMMHQQNEMKRREAEEKRRQHEEKITQARDKNDEILMYKKMDYDEKLARNEERRRMFEREKESKRGERQRRADAHSKTIQKVIEGNRRIIEARKEEYYNKKALAEERKRELDEIAEHRRQMKLQEEQENEMRRRQIKENMEMRLSQRVDLFQHKQREEEHKVEMVQKKKWDDIQHKHTLEMLKQNDKNENVKRIQRMQEYQREKLLERIMSETERAEKIKMERSNLQEMKMEFRRQIESSKRELLDKFEKVKQGKADLESLSGELPPKTQSVMDHPVSHQSSRGNHSAQYPRKLKSSSKKLHRPESEQVSEADARKQIENLKFKQNNEMLRVLEEEQTRENEREKILNGVNEPQEKKRTEKVFAMDRAKAHARIQQLADQHDEAIKALMNECKSLERLMKTGQRTSY